jgi:hypothetical protein
MLNPTFSKPAATWQWTPFLAFRTPGGDTLPNPTIKPTLTTTYHLMVTDTDGCPAQDSLMVTVEGGPPASIDDFGQNIGVIHLPYPNPADEEVIFSATLKEANELTLSLYDLTGRNLATIFQGKVGQGDFVKKWERDPQLAGGLYLISWEVKGRRFVQKVQLR